MASAYNRVAYKNFTYSENGFAYAGNQWKALINS